jgi:hypothetical protein
MGRRPSTVDSWIVHPWDLSIGEGLTSGLENLLHKNKTAAAFGGRPRRLVFLTGWRDLRKPAVEMRLVFVVVHLFQAVLANEPVADRLIDQSLERR